MGDEAGVDDDAVGVVEAQVALVVDGEVGLDPQAPAQALGDARRSRRPGPSAQRVTRRPGLLLDLTGEALEQGLALVDHPAGRAPVVGAVASPVPHQKEPVRSFQQSPPDGPLAHRRQSGTRRAGRADPGSPGRPGARGARLAGMEEPPAGRAVRIVEEAARAAGLSIVVVHHAGHDPDRRGRGRRHRLRRRPDREVAGVLGARTAEG